jgi:hypothetical protein
VLAAILALGVVAGADTVEYRGDRGELEVRVPRIEEAAIRVDGRLVEPAWDRGAVLTGFTQSDPVEGIAASQETEVRVMYGPDAIYFGVTARDEEAGLIRGTLTQRDEGVTDDDWIRILLDTFDDRSQAYAFYVNPRGVQADGLWLVGKSDGFGDPVDFNPDFLWESAAEVTPEGWVAEIRIPYASLRFREAVRQRWALNVGREIHRTGYRSDWAPLTANVANPLELSGVLVGMEGLEPRRLVELNPVATGRRTGERAESGEFVREDFSPSLGLNARYGITRNLVLDATLNPDFSQVEADADQVAINERFALFFPEKRPFFLEGTEVFSTPQQLVYTRAIVDPVAGAKLTGKLGAFNVGYLGAVDESPVTFDEGSDEALFNLLRLRRDVGSGSTVGALYTDRTLLDGSAYNRVAALDARLVIGGRYFLTTQAGGSWTRDEDGGDPAFGPIVEARLERSGRHINWEAGIEDVHPDFRARSGFIRRTGDARVSAEAGYTFIRPAGSFLEDFGPELELEAFYDHDDLWGGRGYHEARAQLGLDVSLRGPNGFVLQASTGYFAFDPADYAGYQVGDAGAPGPFPTPDALSGLRRLSGFGRARPLPWLAFRFRGGYGEVPIFAEAARGVELSLSPSAELRFAGGLSADASFSFSRILRHRDDSRFSLAQIPRLKVQYQFTRALFARGILQYNLQERDTLRDAAGAPLLVDGVVSQPMEGGEMRYDFLLSYEPSPGTILYAGWTRQLDGPETYRYGQLTPVAEGLFVKVSYLFRL